MNTDSRTMNPTRIAQLDIGQLLFEIGLCFISTNFVFRLGDYGPETERKNFHPEGVYKKIMYQNY